MPGRLFLTRDVEDLAGLVSVHPPEPEPPRRNIQPGQDVLTLTVDGFQRMRWGMIPTGRKNARGRPVMDTIINARSETVFDKTAFHSLRRAVVPADGWYEWTGPARRKTAWQITSKDGMPLWFAAIFDVWHGPGGVVLPQMATLTCPPNADLQAIHDRMGVLLSVQDVKTWIAGDDSVTRSLLVPWPVGRLRVQEAENMDWTQP